MPENLIREQNMIVCTLKMLERTWNGLGFSPALPQKIPRQLGI